MEYYEFHYLIKDLVDYLKKENESNQGQKDQTSDMMGKFKMPSLKMPNISVPKL